MSLSRYRHLFRPAARMVSAALLFSLAILAAESAARAAEEGKRSFDIPSNVAAAALKQFTRQSGQGLVVASDAVNTVRTNPVKGEFTADEALALLLNGTGLVADRDEKTG